MLKHFADNKDNDYKYYLYGVYKSGQHKLPHFIDVEFAKKNFFTKTHQNAPIEYLYQQLNLSDNDITLFLQKLTIDINAVGLEMQEKAVREELCKVLDCKIQQIEPYYCNALSIIRRLATQTDLSDRTISLSQFIQEVKDVDNQFEVWLLHKNGSANFAKAIKKKYFNNGLNISPYDRFFIIECNKNTSIIELKTILLRISDSEDAVMLAIIENYSIESIINAEGEPDRKYILEANPLGIVRDDIFERGGDTIAIPPKDVKPATRTDIDAIYAKSIPAKKKFVFAELSSNPDIEVPVDGNKFFNKHIAIVGSTGSGKSHTVAKII